MILFNKGEIRRMIVDKCERFGGQKGYSNYLGYSQQYLNDIIHGRRDIPLTILKDLNIKKEVRYIRYMIKFRDYRNYPDDIVDACRFRDEYDDLPDGAFSAIAEEKGLTDLLEIMAEWEWDNTDCGR